LSFACYEKSFLLTTNMEHITKLIGEPTQDWPKHAGHLKNADRFRLVTFLACNGVPEILIKRLRDDSSIFLKDKHAKTSWDKLAEKFSRNEDSRNRFHAYNLRQQAYVPIADGQDDEEPAWKKRKFDFIFYTGN
jgi:hypothetical protein